MENEPTRDGPVSTDLSGATIPGAEGVPPAGDALASTQPRATGNPPLDFSPELLWKSFSPEVRERYEFRGLLGEGGMGVVLEALDRRMDRTVALKGLKPGRVISVTQRERQEKEARIAAAFTHGNILPVYDQWRDLQGNPWVSMMRIPDGSSTLAAHLASLSDRRAFEERPIGALLQIFGQLCRGMSYAHSRGFLHRDLKPENIFLGSSGEALIADWGIAVETDHVRKGTPNLAGTPGYASPEQMGSLGEARADERSDVYSLGMILYEMVVGRRAHDAATGATSSPPPSLVRPRDPEIPARVPRELAEIVRRATAADPGARTPDVATLGRALDTYLQGGLVEGVHYRAHERLLKWARRNRTLSTSLALTFLFLVGFIHTQRQQLERERALVQSETRQRERAETALLESRIRASSASALGLGAVRPAEALVHATLAGLLERSREGGLGSLVAPALHRVLEVARETDAGKIVLPPAAPGAPVEKFDGSVRITGEGDLWFVSTRPAAVGLHEVGKGAVTWSLPVESTLLDRMAVDPAGRFAVIADASARILVVSRGGEQAEPLEPATGGLAWALAISPDGERIAAADAGGRIRVWARGAGKGHRDFGPLGAIARALAFHPDGKRLAAGSEDGMIHLWELENGAHAILMPPVSSGAAPPVRSLAFVAGGHLLASTDEQRALRMWNLEATDPTAADASWSPEGDLKCEAVWAGPSGRYLITAGYRESTEELLLEMRDWRGNRLGAPLPVPGSGQDAGAGVTDVRVVAEGTRLVAALATGDFHHYDAWGALSGPPTVSYPGPGFSAMLGTSRRGAMVVTAGGEGGWMRLWSPAGEPLGEPIQAHAAGAVALAVHPTGALIVTAGTGAELKFWTVEGKPDPRIAGRRLPAEVMQRDEVRALALHPSRDLLALVVYRAILVMDLTSGMTRRAEADADTAYTSLAWTPDGQLVTGSRGAGWQLWKLADGNPPEPVLIPAASSGAVDCLAVSPDGARLATGHSDGAVRLWPLGGKGGAVDCRGSLAHVTSITFSPAGDWLAATSRDGSVRAWDLAGGVLWEQAKAHGGYTPHGVAITDGGHRTLTSGDDGTLRPWRSDPDEWLDILRRRLASHPVMKVTSPAAPDLARARDELRPLLDEAGRSGPR